MKIAKQHHRIQIRVDKQLKDDAEILLAEKYNKSMSEFLREKLEELVEKHKEDLK